jgi:predicted  nucleic acid-binding Zn-ribbon protein
LRDKLRALLELQLIDSRIEHLTAEAARLVNDPELATMRAELAAKESAAAALSESLKELARQIRWSEGEVKGLRENIRKQERKLYGGTIGNPKELASLQAKIEEIKANISRLEDQALELMMRVEETEPRSAAAEDAAAQAGAVVAEREAKNTALSEATRAELASLPARREQAASAVEPRLLADYNYVRPRRGGLAVVVITRGACPSCRMQVPAMLQSRIREGQEIVRCESCGCYLCWPE